MRGAGRAAGRPWAGPRASEASNPGQGEPQDGHGLGPVRPRREAADVEIPAEPAYTTNLPVADLGDDDVLLALKHDGDDLTPDHGGPLRLVVPKLYFWKSAKWLRAFEFLDVNPPGFWE